MKTGNARKAELLGMPFGTASGRLRKTLLFVMAQRLGEDTCYRCDSVIEKEEEFSIEHKIAWAPSSDPLGMFFSLENIAFSHISCNVGAEKPYRRIWPKGQKNRNWNIRRSEPDRNAKLNLSRRLAYDRGDNPNRAKRLTNRPVV